MTNAAPNKQEPMVVADPRGGDRLLDPPILPEGGGACGSSAWWA